MQMNLAIYQVDAFTDHVFGGNPAAVIPLESWLDDATLQAIASENNLSETAYFVPTATGYELRWFMPTGEVNLCGHGTLATAHVLFTHLRVADAMIHFDTKSGRLSVEKHPHGYAMVLPAISIYPVRLTDIPDKLALGLGLVGGNTQAVDHNMIIDEVLTTSSGSDYIVVLSSSAALETLMPDQSQWTDLNSRRVIVTAMSDDANVDFVSRCLYTQLGKSEDPVTGSAHCQLTPYWVSKLGKTKLTATQLSKRRGYLHCELIKDTNGDRIKLIGNAVDYMVGQITL